MTKSPRDLVRLMLRLCDNWKPTGDETLLSEMALWVGFMRGFLLVLGEAMDAEDAETHYHATR